jgi:anti-anti-sigma factor
MDIKVRTETGKVPVTVVHVDGNIDSATYQAFQSEVEGLIKNGARHVLVDLTHVSFVSSAGLRALHIIFNQLRAVNNDIDDDELRKGISAGTYKSPHLKLLNPSKDSKATLQMAGFDMYIESHDNLQTAIASF